MKRSTGARRLAAVSLTMAGALVATVPAGAATGAPAQARPDQARSQVQVQAARCHTGSLSASVGRMDAGAGQRYATLTVTNRSKAACSVYGFPGLIMLDGNDDALRTRTRRENVRPQQVTLRPGASAYARLHWRGLPMGAEKTCPPSARVLVIPPAETAPLKTAFSAAVCDDGLIDVTPLAARRPA